jgi:hypothetical protein
MRSKSMDYDIKIVGKKLEILQAIYGVPEADVKWWASHLGKNEEMWALPTIENGPCWHATPERLERVPNDIAPWC